MATPTFPDIDRAKEYAEYILAVSDKCPTKFVKPSSGSSNKNKSIHQKLIDLYIEESMKEPENEDLVYASNLLAKLAKRERLNCMVLSLYPGSEGYSIMLRSRSGVESETMKLPYEESEILEFVDAAQLPPFLLDLLEKAQMNVFYSGCVICEVRDYRRSATGSHDTQYVLLRPSPQSLLRDITAMSCDGHVWGQDDLFHLESELILATEEPLCLDPSPAVMYVENAIQYEEKYLNDPALKRSVKRNTQAAVNRKRKLAQAPAPKGMHLYDFLTRKKDKGKPASSLSLGQSKTRLVVDTFKQKFQPQLSAPESVEVKKIAKLPEVPANDGKIFVEEHTMERDPALDRHMMAKITIYQPQLGDNYFGEFYLDHDYSQGKTGEDGRRCRFVIGSRACVDRYLQQFKDLFTEEGKLQVKIAVQKANEPAPIVYYTQVVTPAPPTPTPTAITINSAQALVKQVMPLQQPVKAGEMGTVTSLQAKRNIPIQLSLSISPAASLANSQAILAQANAVGIPSSLSAQFIASSLPSGSIMTAQRLKAQGSVSSQLRPSSSPLTSPAVPPKVSTPQQLNIPTTASLIAIPKAPTPTPAQTPPPSARTPTPTSAGTRRSSTTELTLPTGSVGQTQQVQQQNLSNFLQGLTPGAAAQNNAGENQGSVQQQQQQQQQSGGITNISIGNLGSLPPNINIQGLTGIPGVNITNLPGLPPMQVSLAQIAVPITMINNNPSLLQAQSGLLGTACTTSGTNAATFVTMVTALQASSSNTATSTSASVASQVASTGQASNTTTVIPQGSGMLSFPVGLSGLNHLISVPSKSQGGQGIRGPTAMPLLQFQGQQGGPIQLLSLQQQRGQVKSGGSSGSSTGQQSVARLAQGATPTVPLSSVLNSQQMTAIAVSGKPGQGGGAPITAQQLIQLASGSGTPLGQGPSQLATHVAFQKGQAGGQQTLQFHSLQLKPGTAALAQAQGGSKNKSKKRTTPTPPK